LLAALSTTDLFDHRGLLERHGVKPICEMVDAPPGRIICTVSPDRSERSFLTQRGANELLSPFSLQRVDWSTVAWCHVSGYLLSTVVGRETYAHVAQICCEREIPVSLDPASSAEIERLGSDWVGTVGELRLLKSNAQEAKALTGESRPDQAASILLRTAETVVITLGAAGALAATRGGEVVRVASVAPPTLPPRLIDPTGAGDAFAAGLLLSLHRGDDLETAVTYANLCGAQAVTRLGARP
jgi:sugar/nucleoside kinase (ribokinase family)